MKAHVGVDAASGLVHSVVGTAANESDVSQAHALLHGHEEHAFGDAGYTGVDKREEMQGKTVKWQVAVKRGKIKALRDGAVKDLLIAVDRASVPRHQESVWSSQGSLQGPGQEHGAVVQPVWFGESGVRQEAVVGLRGEQCVLSAPSAARKGAKREKDGLNRPISAALRKLKSLACATSSANLIDQRFPKIEIPTKAMNLSKEQLLHAYQWDMKFMSEDDIPLASLLASLEHQHSIPTRERWQAALDFLYRLITCGLADITWVGEIERNLPKLYESLAKTPPLQLDPGYWLELQAYGTDKCIDLIKRHQIDWDSPLDPLFSKELEEMFIKQGVGIDQSPLVSIQF